MTHFDEIYEIAADNYGLISYSQAKNAGLVGAELNRYVESGRLQKRGHGLYKLVRYTPTDLDAYAEAVAQVGEGAYLCGESVLALHGLALVNPEKIKVATAKRVRKKIPDWIEIVNEAEPCDMVHYAGIPSQSVTCALLACKTSVMPDRLIQAVEDARAQGLVSKADYVMLARKLV